MAVGGLLNKAKEATAKAKEVGTERVNSAQGKVQDMTQKALTALKGVEPILKSCGFIIGDVKATMSVPPAFTVVVEQTAEGSTCLDAVLEEQGANLTKIQHAIIKGIRDAYTLEKTVNPLGFTVGQVEMELGLPPNVHVHLNSKKSRAFG